MKAMVAAWMVSLAVVPAMAHHSFSTEYDRSKPVSVTGCLVRRARADRPCPGRACWLLPPR